MCVWMVEGPAGVIFIRFVSSVPMCLGQTQILKETRNTPVPVGILFSAFFLLGHALSLCRAACAVGGGEVPQADRGD